MHIDLWALAVPLWLVAFPALTLVAALAVLFECVPVLRGGVGNMLFFLLYLAALTLSVVGSSVPQRPTSDQFRIGYVTSDMQQMLLALDPEYDGDVALIAERQEAEPLLFRWPGATWTARMLLGRLWWIGVAAALALVAALPFDRFDPARTRPFRRP